MRAQTFATRITLTFLGSVFALVATTAAPLTTFASDHPVESSPCWTGSYITYLDCIDANGSISSVRGTSSYTRPAIVHDTITDYVFMEQNMWGETFDPARLFEHPHSSVPDDASLTRNGVVSY